MILINDYLKQKYGCKVYKLALNGGFTCPNRDGTLDTRGCIFCSAGGSGEFAGDPAKTISEQLEEAKLRVAAKMKGEGRYIAYFQAFTGTYAPVEHLRRLYEEAIRPDDVVALSIATRPDCLSPEVMELLKEINRIKPVWVELGLQTIHPETAEYIRRGYPPEVYDEAVRKLRDMGLEVITHVILGLPGETEQDMLETVDYVCRSGATGIKLQLLHVLKGTDLAKEYEAGKFEVMDFDIYIHILQKCSEIIPDTVIVHRLTGDGDKKLLLAPLWSADKKRVWNRITAEVLKSNKTGKGSVGKNSQLWSWLKKMQ